MKIEVIKTKNYIVYFEDDYGFTFIHCDCIKWNKSVKRELKIDFDNLFNAYKKDIYAIHEIGDSKHEKFVRFFGFEYLKDFDGTDGKLRQIYVRRISWDLKRHL